MLAALRNGFHISITASPDARTFLFAKPLTKLGHTGFRAIGATKPDRTSANRIADHDPVVLAIAPGVKIFADYAPEAFATGGLVGPGSIAAAGIDAA